MTEKKFFALVVSVILSFNLCLIGNSWFSLTKSKKQYIESAAITAQNLSQVLEQNISGTINTTEMGIFDLAREVERQLAAGGVDKKALGDYMVRAQKHLLDLDGLRVADAGGNIFYPLQSPNSPRLNITDRDYFSILKNDKQIQLAISKPMKGKIADRWIIVLARRINRPDGSFGGVALGALPLNKIDQLFSSIKVGRYGAFALRDGTDLSLVARYPEHEGIGSAVGHKKMSNEFLELLKKGQTVGWYNAPSGLDRRMRTWGFRKFSNNRYFIFVGLAQDEYLAKWQTEVMNTGIFLGILFLLSCIAGTATFVSWKRKKAADESLQAMANKLRDSETLYRTLFEQSPDGIILWSTPELEPLQFNSAAHTMLDYTREEFSSLTVSDLDARDDSAVIANNMDKLNKLGIVSFESVHRTKTGAERNVYITLQPLDLAGHSMILANHRDITELKKAEEKQRETEELFSLFMKYTPIYTYIKHIEDGRSRIIEVSDNFIEMVGIKAEELRGRTMEDVFPVEFARKITSDDIAVMNKGTVVQFDEELNGLSYTTIKFPIKREGKSSLLAGFTIDITEKKRAEEERQKLENQLLHTQKLESLGVLAGGIAHDFNNILTSIVGNADLALMRISKESPVAENLRRIEHGASQAADLAKQMLAYSGKGKFVVDSLDLGNLLQEMLHMLEVSISKKAVLRLNLTPLLPSVEADATQMRQIIMNLVINASEAIGDKSGVIAITTGCMDCDNNYLKDVWLDENLTDGLYVYLEIADTGCGMDKGTLSKIFDPFFTTKFTGRGLGMAAVLGIVRGHKGAIKVYSEQHKGTTFKILLPASNKPVALFNGNTHSDDWKGAGKVLLVDDEETVRGIGKEMLQELGFTTFTANDGREGIEVFKNNSDIAFVILDLTMPHMDGEQCFRELRQLKPDVKVIMSSGFSEYEVSQKFIGKGLAGFIQKPYKLSVLRDAIRKI